MMKKILFLLLFIAVAAAAAPPSGVVTTVAGQPGVAGYWDGPAGDALFTHPTWLDVAVGPSGLTCDQGKSGEIFLIDRMNQRVRRISENGDVSTMPVPAAPPYLTFSGTAFPLDFDSAFGGGILVEPPRSGCGCGQYARGFFVSSTGRRQVVLAAMTYPFLGNRDQYPVVIGTGDPGAHDGMPFSEAQFQAPVGIARSANGGNEPTSSIQKQALYIADSGNHTIRRVSFTMSFEFCPQPRAVTTLAGAAGQPGSADGTGSAARFNTPRGIAAMDDGTLYVTDAGNHTVRRITPAGVVTTVAGTPGVAGSDDTHLNTPSGIDVDANGNVYVVDTFNHAVRRIGSDGKLITVAGQLGVSGFADGDAATAKFNAPVGLKIAPDGSLVVADTGNNVIRRVTLK